MVQVHGIGEILKQKRIELGLSLSDIENETKIRHKYLQAIEEENFEVIPGKVYLKGFVKSYAKYLNISGNEEIAQFLEDNRTPAFEIEKNEPLKEKKHLPQALPRKYITIMFSIMAILILFGLQNFYERISQEPEITPPDIGQVEEPLPPLNENPPVENEPELPKQNEFVIEILDLTSAQEKCWMKIYSDDNLVYEGTMYEGEQKSISAQEKIKIRLGDAGVVKLTLGETDLGIPGNKGQVLEKEFILSDFQ